MTKVTLTVNGERLAAEAEPRTHLADLLREAHNLTGTHIGCEHGVCGACTVLIDGAPARSCITFAVTCEGAAITTIEGLDDDEIAAELRAAFTREHALQCGYCTPGVIVAARDLALRLEAPSEREIRVAMSGNLCRCTGYVGIIRAIGQVIADRRRRGIAAVPAGGRECLGPVGAGHAGPTGAPAPTAAKVEAPIGAVSAIRVGADWKPQASFKQRFTIAHSADEVWEFFGRIGEVAACLPGASIDRASSDGNVEGRMKVKVGPIAAEFRGAAEVTRDAASQSGAIFGSGRDPRGRSATRGSIRYFVRPGEAPDECQVDLDVGYTLTGALGQFGRSGLVEDVASRLTRAFARNLDARLSGAATPDGATPALPETVALNIGSLVWSVALVRLRRLLSRLAGRGRTARDREQ